MTSPQTRLEWSDAIGKRVRSGGWADQAVPTLVKAREALAEAGDEFGLRAGRREVAAQLVDSFMEEAKVVYVIYKVWTAGFLDWLAGQGVSDTERSAEIGRLRLLMAYPDGTPLDPEARWADLGSLAGRVSSGIRSYDLTMAAAEPLLVELSEGWRRLHDRYADLMSGVLAWVAHRFGEVRLEDCYRAVLEPYIQERYMVFDTRVTPYPETLERNMYLVMEAMRGHLCGPERDGTLGIAEDDDKWVVSFAPCGSGGRSMQGDDIEGTGSRVLAPYEFGVMTERRDWAWNTEGICYYCAHCCLALEKLPMERWGHPVRVVDPPRWGGAADAPETRKQCTWTVYKTLDAIPDEVYRRVGHTKPQLPMIDAPRPPDEPMSEGARRAGLVAGIAGVIIVTFASLYTAVTYVGLRGQSYSPLNHWVSELGERGVSPSAFVFNAGLVVTGICFVAFMLALRPDVPGLLGLAGVAIGVVACVAASLVGVFPMDDLASHARVALTFFGLGWIAVLVLTTALYRNGRVGMGIVALAIATAACFVGFLLVAFSGHEVGDALAAPTVREAFSLSTTLEWLLLIGVNLWILLVAIGLLRDDPRGTAAPHG